MRVLRWIVGTPAVAVAFTAGLLIELLVVFTIIGIIVVAIWHEDGGMGAFAPAVALAEAVYK